MRDIFMIGVVAVQLMRSRYVCYDDVCCFDS